MPNIGTLFILAYEIASIIPSIPLSPKPPGTIIPSQTASLQSTVSLFISSEFIHFISTVDRFSIPA